MARELAVRAHYELEFRKEEQLPLQIKRFSDVLYEYERLRESQNARGTYAHNDKANQQHTSDYTLRQIRRMSKFWHEYCGKKPAGEVGNALLRDYYHRTAKEKRPKNHSLNSADKTLE